CHNANARSAKPKFRHASCARPPRSAAYGAATSLTETASRPLAVSPGGSPFMNAIAVVAFCAVNSVENLFQACSPAFLLLVKLAKGTPSMTRSTVLVVPQFPPPTMLPRENVMAYVDPGLVFTVVW